MTKSVDSIAHPSPAMMSAAVRSLLNPTSIAIVGASESSPWATAFVENIRRWRFPGSLHMVNPSREEVYGQTCFPTVSAIGERVDHALIVVRAELVPTVLRDCAAAGVRAGTIVASGFSEAGPVGKRLADEVVAIAREHEMHLVGPNCYGFMNFAENTVVSRNFLEADFRDDGAISLVCQSGYLGLVSYGKAHQVDAGIRYSVSSGNELVTDANDYFEYFIDDPGTRVLGGILEQIPDPRRFERVALRALEAGKPIVLLKLGTSAISAELTASHTGAIAGDREVVETFLRELGVITVRTVDELIETCALLARSGWPVDGRTAFISGSGGAGEYFADLVDGSAVDLVPFSSRTTQLIAEVTGLAPGAIHNPLDLTSSAEGQFTGLAPMIATTGEYGLVVGVGHELRGEDVEGEPFTTTARSHMGAIGQIREKGGQAFLFSGVERAPTEYGRNLAREYGSEYLRGKAGVEALHHAIVYGASKDARAKRIRDLLSRRESTTVPLPARRGTLSERDAKAVLAAHGLRVTRDLRANSAAEAVSAARTIGYPVVMKIDSELFPHKTEVNGVMVGLSSDESVAAAYETIFDGARKLRPDVSLTAVQVCEQIDAPVEMIIGARVDASIGPILVVGLGGVLVEVLGDTAFLLPPFDRGRVAEALRSLRSWPLLDGYRGAVPLATASLEELVVRVGDLVSAWGADLAELDLNPVFVTTTEAIIGDALVVLKEAN
jgi:acyl-CoA synthetase (NDP forming)